MHIRTPNSGALFQSTRPRGARLTLCLLSNFFNYVSIHAPTWGATDEESCYSRRACSFNPRAHVGRDKIYQDWYRKSSYVSIHAPTWGATQQHHRGLDREKVSIHAPTWGATGRADKDYKSQMFQSTRPRGARRSVQKFACLKPKVSIHAPTWGATEMIDSRSSDRCFNPRAHVGRDR